MQYLLCEAAAAAILCRAAWAFCRAVEWSASCCSASARVCSRVRMEAVLLRDPPANHTSCKLLWAAPSTSILFIAKLCPGILQVAAVTAAAENEQSWRRHWCACAHGVCGVHFLQVQESCAGDVTRRQSCCTCEQASRVEVIAFQSDAASADLLVECQSLGCA